MNGQTYACSQCGCRCENVMATFVHIFTVHMGRDIIQEPAIARRDVERMKPWTPPAKWGKC